jgi:hypothetical protein
MNDGLSPPRLGPFRVPRARGCGAEHGWRPARRRGPRPTGAPAIEPGRFSLNLDGDCPDNQTAPRSQSPRPRPVRPGACLRNAPDRPHRPSAPQKYGRPHFCNAHGKEYPAMPKLPSRPIEAGEQWDSEGTRPAGLWGHNADRARPHRCPYPARPSGRTGRRIGCSCSRTFFVSAPIGVAATIQPGPRWRRPGPGPGRRRALAIWSKVVLRE